MKTKKWFKLILVIIIFQISFFLIQLCFSNLMNLVFWYNHRIGINQWNGWIFDYSSSEMYLNGFWGIVQSDFCSLVLSIFVSLALLENKQKHMGLKLLLVYRVVVKLLFIGVNLYLVNSNILTSLGYGLLLIIIDLIPFGIYRFKEYLLPNYY